MNSEALSAEIKRRTDANCSVGISGVAPSFGRRKTIENVSMEFKTTFRAHGAIERSLNSLVTVFCPWAYGTYITGALRGVWSTVHITIVSAVSTLNGFGADGENRKGTIPWKFDGMECNKITCKYVEKRPSLSPPYAV